METDRLYIGIEGGASRTEAVLIDESGTVYATVQTGPSNPWVLGFEKVAKVLKALLDDLLEKGGSSWCHVISVGMTMSGAGQLESQSNVVRELKILGVDTSKIYVGDDLLGPVPNGGVVIIAGTGSNCVVYNFNGSSKRAGGWGHLLGDEGGAYWIAQRAIKQVFDRNDNMNISCHDLTRLSDEIKTYFKVTDLSQLLPYFYSNFQKDFIARFTKVIAELASKENDAASQQLFNEAGFTLGNHLRAIAPHIDRSICEDNRLRVVAMGSVFHSWKFLKPGFMDALSSSENTLPFNQIDLLRLTTSAAIGAAIWGARQHGNPLINVDFSKSFDILDTIKL